MFDRAPSLQPVVYENGTVVPSPIRLAFTLDQKIYRFRMQRIATLRSPMHGICERIGLMEHEIFFCFNCERISPRDTPMTLGMKDGDDIDIMWQN